MKLKLLLYLTIVCMVSVFSAQAAFALSALGQNPFNSTKLGSEEEMKQMLLEHSKDVEEGLTKAGLKNLSPSLMAQLPDAEISRVQYFKGQKFEWMFYRKDGKGKVRIDKDVVWEADEPIRSFEFPVDFEGQRYTFAVPPVCGNLTLVGVGPIPAAPAPVIAKQPEPAPQEVKEEVAAVEAKGFPILIDAGYLHQLDPAHHALVRIGMEYPISDNFSVIGMIGGAPKISGEDGKGAFTADVFANYSISRFFVGLGVGAWLTSGDSDLDAEDSDLDLIVNAGARLFGEPDGFNTSLFVEVRSGVDELDDFDMYGRIGAGLRFRF